MSITEFKDLLIPISGSLAILASAVGIWKALQDWRLKVRAETRLKDSAEIEAQVTLLKLFTEIMNIAHGRGGHHVSDKAIELLLSNERVVQLQTSASIPVKDILEKGAILTLPIGAAAQDAAIAAIFVLGERHTILRAVAIQALRSLCSFRKDIAEPYLHRLEKIEKSPNHSVEPTL